MPTKLKILSIIILLVIISTVISASAGGGNNCQNGSWIDDNYDYRSTTVKYIRDNSNNISEVEKQKIIEDIDRHEVGMQRAKRECEISKVNPKTARLAQDIANRKIKLQDVANRLVNSIKDNKGFDIQVMEVYELGEFSREIGLDLNPTTSPDLPMTVKYDKEKIAKIDLIAINAEAEQAKLDLPNLSQEVKNVEKQFEDNAKAVDTKYDMDRLYRNRTPWYTPITDFFSNIFNAISRIFGFE
jgi:hypothetical protein